MTKTDKLPNVQRCTNRSKPLMSPKPYKNYKVGEKCPDNTPAANLAIFTF